MDSKDRKPQKHREGGVCVRLEPVPVCEGDSWLYGSVAGSGSVLPPLMPSSRNPPAGSVHATSVAASRVEQALSEVASSLQSSAPKQGPLHPWMTLAQIWLHAGTAPPLNPMPTCRSVRGELAAWAAGFMLSQGPDLHPRLSLRGTAERGVPDPTEVWQSCSLGVEPQSATYQQPWAIASPLSLGFLICTVGSIASSLRVGEHSAWHTLVVKSKRPWERGQVC